MDYLKFNNPKEALKEKMYKGILNQKHGEKEPITFFRTFS